MDMLSTRQRAYIWDGEGRTGGTVAEYVIKIVDEIALTAACKGGNVGLITSHCRPMGVCLTLGCGFRVGWGHPGRLGSGHECRLLA